MSNDNKYVQNLLFVRLNEINLQEFAEALGPAQLVNNTISFELDIVSGIIKGISGGGSMFKAWSTQALKFATTIVPSSDVDASKTVQVVCMNAKLLIDTLRVIGDKPTITCHLYKTADDKYAVNIMTLSTEDVSIRYACTSPEIGMVKLDADAYSSRFDAYGTTTKFKMTKDQLGRIRQLGRIQTLDKLQHNIIFERKDTYLRVHNSVFDVDFKDIIIAENFAPATLETAVLNAVDNDNSDVMISFTKSNVRKIVFTSNDREIKFVSSLRVDTDAHVDTTQIDNAFKEYAK